MKTKLLNKNQVHAMVKNELQSTMSVVIETKQDIRSLPTVIEKFIGTDLTKVSIFVFKHQ